MDEPALDLNCAPLSPQKETVRVFYKELWDHADKSLIPHIFHTGFTFRGSLGPTLVGHEQFADYVDWVTGTFGHRHPGHDRGRQSRYRQHAIPRFSSQGIFWRAAE